jgi:hypothetical protein
MFEPIDVVVVCALYHVRSGVHDSDSLFVGVERKHCNGSMT